MAATRLLVVDDDASVRLTLSKVLESHGFEVTTAKNVPDALRAISHSVFDVLLSDLHMPGAGDGLTVVSAMRHANPAAVTLLLSAYPDISRAANAILLQADEVLVKPMKIPDLVATISRRLAKGPLNQRKVETLGAILERTASESIEEWFHEVEKDPLLRTVTLGREDRCRHLPQLFLDLEKRLTSSAPLGTEDLVSASAVRHGVLRRRQGYTAEMMVKESRTLQVIIFHSLQKNLGTVDFSLLLLGVMTIADEVNSQLSQSMKSYVGEALVGSVTPHAASLSQAGDAIAS